jgi:lambda repressor-like predicted transcriptional regulator
MPSKYRNNVKSKNMIGNNVKRKKKGFTLDGLSRKADIPYTTLTKLESNVVKKTFCSNSSKDC